MKNLWVVVTIVIGVLVFAFLMREYFSAASFVISVFALLFSALSFAYRVSPSLAARFETKPYTDVNPSVNYGGSDPLTRGEEYLDLVIANGGPGIAMDVEWVLEIEGYREGDNALKGAIPVLQANGSPVVQGLLKVYHENRSHTRNAYRESHHIPNEEDLSNEDVKAIEETVWKIRKYTVRLSYRGFLGQQVNAPSISFNEEGGYISNNRRE